MTTPSCTFIVSAFNRPVHLRLCLLSLVVQTRKDWSCIVTDNSKTERNRVAVNEIGDSRIAYIPTGEFCPSCYHSAEVGAVLATGEWLAFPSEDSYYCDDFLERMIEESSDADFVHCDLLYDKRLTGRRVAMRSEPKNGFIDKTNWIVRRSKFIGFPDKRDDGSPCPADGQAVERMVALGRRTKHVPEILCVHN